MVSPPEPIAMYCGVGLSILLASDHHGAQVAGSSALHSARQVKDLILLRKNVRILGYKASLKEQCNKTFLQHNPDKNWICFDQNQHCNSFGTHSISNRTTEMWKSWNQNHSAFQPKVGTVSKANTAKFLGDMFSHCIP